MKHYYRKAHKDRYIGVEIDKPTPKGWYIGAEIDKPTPIVLFPLPHIDQIYNRHL